MTHQACILGSMGPEKKIAGSPTAIPSRAPRSPQRSCSALPVRHNVHDHVQQRIEARAALEKRVRPVPVGEVPVQMVRPVLRAQGVRLVLGHEQSRGVVGPAGDPELGGRTGLQVHDREGVPDLAGQPRGLRQGEVLDAEHHQPHLRDWNGGPEGGAREGLEGGVWDPNVGVPEMAQEGFPGCKSCLSHNGHFGGGGGGSSGG